MARDRQRAKQRRKRQGGSAPRGGATRSAAARKVGLDDAKVEDAGSGDSAGTPDPLKNSSAEVDQAKLAEAGAVPPDPDRDDDAHDELDDFDELDRAPDEAEDDFVPPEH